MGEREHGGEDGCLADPGRAARVLLVARDDRGRLGAGRSIAQAVTSPSTFGFAPSSTLFLPARSLPNQARTSSASAAAASPVGLAAMRSAERLHRQFVGGPRRMCQGEGEDERKPQRGASAHGVSFGGWRQSRFRLCYGWIRSWLLGPATVGKGGNQLLCRSSAIVSDEDVTHSERLVPDAHQRGGRYRGVARCARGPTLVPSGAIADEGTAVGWIASALRPILAMPAARRWLSVTGRLPAIEFNRDIRPILSDHCYQCHGPDGARRKAEPAAGSGVVGQGRSRRAARDRARRPRGQRALPADHGRGRFGADAARQVGEDPQRRPDRTNPPLDRRGGEVAAALGVHPARAARRFPTSGSRDWVRNPIDAFILARLEREGLAPAPEAERGILIRRVTLDLTGLPPTRAEIDAFENDTGPERLREGRRPPAGLARGSASGWRAAG